MKRAVSLAVALCALAVVPGLSQAEYYLSAYLGKAEPSDDTRADDNTGAGLQGQLSFDSGIAAGARAGYWLTGLNIPYVGVEADFNSHLPDLDKLDNPGVKSQLDSGVTVLSFTGNLLLRYPGRYLRPYLGGGVGLFRVNIGDGTIATPGKPSSFSSESDSTFGWQWLIGLDWFVVRRVSMFLEYRYSRASDLAFGGGLGLDVSYEVNQFLAGGSYRF